MSLPERIGKFEIKKRLGKGAMGEVFLGVDTVLGREVAIKTILASSSFGEDAKARFEREARSTAALNHPNIVTVYDFGEDEGLLYLVMEYLEGEDMDSLIQKKTLDRAECLEALAQACEGLAFAHERGVIHRDVKPANILVIRRGKKLLAKLMDFGVALINQSNLTEQGIWMGTVNYMAPEYLDTGKASISSDLFAVGVMLYEIVTGGRKPFAGETTTTVLNAILRQAPVPFRPEEIQAVGPHLLKVVRKALVKRPEERYATAEALAAAIREAAVDTVGRPPVPVQDVAPPPVIVKKEAPPERPLIVGKGGKATCLSLRVALRQAHPGARITVLPGVYHESLRIDRDIVLVGEGDPGEIILEATQGPCLTLAAPQAIIQGLTLRPASTEPPSHEPVIHVVSGQATLEDCLLASEGPVVVRTEGTGTHTILKRCQIQGHPQIALEVLPGSTLNLSHCLVEGHRKAGLRLHRQASSHLVHTVFKGADGLGIQVLAGGQAQLEDCELLECQAGGAEVETEGRIQFLRCHLESSRLAGLMAFERSQAILEECVIRDHAAAGIHLTEGANVTLRQCHIHHNEGYGITVMYQGLCTLEGCEIEANGQAGISASHEGTIQLKNCRLHDGRALGIACTTRARGVLEACEIFGHAQSGAKVDHGGSLLLVRCILRDGHDTGLLLFEDAELTLEECVVHRNARGGILLSKDASDPILRGGNRIEDDLLRTNAQGGLTRLAPVKRR